MPAFVVAILALALGACGRSGSPQSTLHEIDDALVAEPLLAPGAHVVEELDWRLPAAVDPLVPIPGQAGMGDAPIQLAGRLYLPAGVANAPLLVFLHGNHSTCGAVTGEGDPRLDTSSAYTLTGVCPEGQIMAPSYRGYDEGARLLASRGYAVASIDANRGINGHWISGPDSGLIVARARLVLRTMALLRAWNVEQNGPLRGRFDLTQVGLMGHSRGGEGVRHAQLIWREEPLEGRWHQLMPELAIRAVFEIAPVDFGGEGGEDTPITTPRDVAWTVLIAACDGDVFDYQGIMPYHRAMAASRDGFQKGIFTVWGANHNFFNSEWQVSDAPNCPIGQTALWDVGAPLLGNARPELLPQLDTYDRERARAGVTGSASQRRIGAAAMVAFFGAHVGTERRPELAGVFDPQFRLPKALAAEGSISRVYSRSGESLALFRRAGDAATAAGGLAVESLSSAIEGAYETFVGALAAQLDGQGDGTTHIFERYGQPLSEDGLVLSWTAASPSNTWDLALPYPDASAYWTLDLVLATRGPCAALTTDACAARKVADASVQLIAKNGSASKKVALADYVAVTARQPAHWRRAWQWTSEGTTTHVIGFMRVLPDTVRIELSDFGFPLTDLAAVRLVFDRTTAGSLIVDDVSLVK